jgi:hypothetical protein
LSEIDDIKIELDDSRDAFGAVKSGCLTITGPSKRLARLYNKDWMSTEASMSELERYLSEIINEETQENVPQKYSSPSEGHFIVLSMLRDWQVLYLLVLEATGGIHNGINVYRRTGILKLQYTNPADCIRPTLSNVKKETDTSLAAKLRQRKPPRKARPSPNAVYMEVETENWEKETVMIV